ncbi:hypothetical protein [Wenzhouxiangella sp. XN24]|uniref:hypothetical protein n=1 Tax=Wenzhouxiangella sp. XN24 TaxID=2713569 RepID=UPI0013EC52DE|nr:hypothetical protein [Wenzhouxiangella sp. XN24]NGX17336.1 hypothetical protein [Wenzhouxiangella sp. XN24]
MEGHWTAFWGFLAGFALLFGVEEFRRLRAVSGDVRQRAPAWRRGSIVFIVAGVLLLLFAVRDIEASSGMVRAAVTVLAGLAACSLVSWGLERVTRRSPQAVATAGEPGGTTVSLLLVGASVLAGTGVAMAVRLVWLG